MYIWDLVTRLSLGGFPKRWKRYLGFLLGEYWWYIYCLESGSLSLELSGRSITSASITASLAGTSGSDGVFVDFQRLPSGCIFFMNLCVE